MPGLVLVLVPEFTEGMALDLRELGLVEALVQREEELGPRLVVPEVAEELQKP